MHIYTHKKWKNEIVRKFYPSFMYHMCLCDIWKLKYGKNEFKLWKRLCAKIFILTILEVCVLGGGWICRIAAFMSITSRKKSIPITSMYN